MQVSFISNMKPSKHLELKYSKQQHQNLLEYLRTKKFLFETGKFQIAFIDDSFKLLLYLPA